MQRNVALAGRACKPPLFDRPKEAAYIDRALAALGRQ
jgi:hypothetical protein